MDMNWTKQSKLASVGCVLVALPLLAWPGKGEKEAIEKLTSEVIVLQRQVRDLQESTDRTSGQMLALIGQIGDNVAKATLAVSSLQSSMLDTQSRLSGGLGGVDSRLGAIETNLQTVNERLARTFDQVSVLNQSVAELQKQAGTIDLTDPIQTFSAAYGDYLRGNYQLAIGQFRLFLAKFPQAEQADDAQFLVGESLYNQGSFEQAALEYDKVIGLYPGGNKIGAARLKKGLSLFQSNQVEVGATELRIVLRDFPDSTEALASRQHLMDRGLPLEDPSQTPRRPKRKGT